MVRRGPCLGIEPCASLTRSQHSTTSLSRWFIYCKGMNIPHVLLPWWVIIGAGQVENHSGKYCTCLIHSVIKVSGKYCTCLIHSVIKVSGKCCTCLIHSVIKVWIPRVWFCRYTLILSLYLSKLMMLCVRT